VCVFVCGIVGRGGMTNCGVMSINI